MDTVREFFCLESNSDLVKAGVGAIVFGGLLFSFIYVCAGLGFFGIL